MATTPQTTSKKSPKNSTTSNESTTSSKSAAAKSTAAKKTRKYAPRVAATVGEVIDEMKHGELHSGGTGKLVTDRKQAIAIGLSEARRSGAKVPPNPNRPAPKKKS